MANTAINVLIDKIKAGPKKIADLEKSSVVEIFELARNLVELRRRVSRGKWAKTLPALGICPRVVCRFLAIGESCLVTQGLLDAELLCQLPADLHKLEWVAKLSLEELKPFLKLIHCKEDSRHAVIHAVQRMIGYIPPAPKEQQASVKHLKKRWADYVSRMVKAIEGLDDQDVDDQTLQQLKDEFLTKFTEVEDALSPQEEVPPSDVVLDESSSDVNEEDDSDEEDTSDEEKDSDDDDSDEEENSDEEEDSDEENDSDEDDSDEDDTEEHQDEE